MIKVFEIIVCMYLKTISPDVPRFTFVCSILEIQYIQYIQKINKNNKYNNNNSNYPVCFLPV
jgi:hypothetical protein